MAKELTINEEVIEKKLHDNKHHRVFVICAHSDDQIIGAGGTIAKLAKEGAKITTIIFSYGELTPAWLKEKYTIKMRVAEANKANKIVKGEKVIFFGMKEGKFIQDAEDMDASNTIKKMVEKEKPSIIFTHSQDDPLPDHRAVLGIVKKSIKKIHKKEERPDVFSFNIWNPFEFKTRTSPRLVVDISGTIKNKIKALFTFKSQRLVILQFLPGVVIGAKVQGFKHNIKNAEVFRKVFID